MANNKKTIQRKDWVSSFTLVGTPKINDYTFKIDERSEKSSWVYNSMNIGIDCGEKHGVVFSELMGGYSDEHENKIYAHGKNEDGTDDYSSQVIVDWEDRFNEDILDSIGDQCFITIGLEKTTKGTTFYKKFLSAYDAIAYVKEHLTPDMVVRVAGNLKYSLYQDKTQVRKTITRIVLSSVDNAAEYFARFTQSVLIDNTSASLKNIDKNKSAMYIDARVLDYIKEYNGIDVRGQYPFEKTFEFELDLNNETLCKRIFDKMFKVKKGVTQINFEGDLIEGGATVTATWDDVPDEIKELVELGLYDEKEVLARCSSNGNREQRMVLRKPVIRLAGEGKTPVAQKFEQRYEEDDLYLDYLFQNDSSEDDDYSGGIESEDSSMDWLNDL